ncbi:MAG: DUF983 domain-containing protein [Acidimicrobiia bacterium]
MSRHAIKTTFWPMVMRGIVRKCPRCGGKPWFTRWMVRTGERCQTCGYKYERQDGFALGATTMNTIFTFGLIAVVIVVGVVASYPHIAVKPMIIVGLFVAILVPILFFPISYTVWAAFDLAMHPLEPNEISDAERALADGRVQSEAAKS